jgi:hypothetical protein
LPLNGHGRDGWAADGALSTQRVRGLFCDGMEEVIAEPPKHSHTGTHEKSGELHLSSVKNFVTSICENPLNSVARKRCGKSLCSLFTIHYQFPKLNVAGSIPVSRSSQLSQGFPPP